jgi:hypothetical protein
MVLTLSCVPHVVLVGDGTDKSRCMFPMSSVLFLGVSLRSAMFGVNGAQDRWS